MNNMVCKKEKGNIEFALTGESIMCRKLSVYREPQFLKMIENGDIA